MFNFRITSIFRPCIAMLFCFLCCFDACQEVPTNQNLSIRLRYYHQDPMPDQASVQTSLKWVLSYLGASLNSGQVDAAIRWEGSTNVLEIDLSKVGFSPTAETALIPILNTIKNAPAYQIQNSIDIGRFVVLTLNSSHHYYAITGVYSSYNAFETAYTFEDSAFLVLENGESSISAGNRVLFRTQNAGAHFTEKAFIAQEGPGSVQQGTFQVSDVEVFDFMPNGQPRFAIYDTIGNLKTAVPNSMGIAGKPAKCMWCHESKIQPNFVGSSPKIQSFNAFVANEQQDLDASRTTFDSDLDYTQLQEHNLAEFLYISFMEPTAQRLAEEWDYPLQQTQDLLQTYSTHIHPEYPQLGPLYERSEIDHLGPHPVLQVPESAREPSTYEPKF